MVNIILALLIFTFGILGVIFQCPKIFDSDRLYRFLTKIRKYPQPLIVLKNGIPKIIKSSRNPIAFIILVTCMGLIFVFLVGSSRPFLEWWFNMIYMPYDPATLLNQLPSEDLWEVFKVSMNIRLHQLLFWGPIYVSVIGSYLLVKYLENPLYLIHQIEKKAAWWVNILMIVLALIMAFAYIITGFILMVIFVPYGIAWLIAWMLLSLIRLILLVITTILYKFIRWVGIHDYESQLQRLSFACFIIAATLVLVITFVTD